MNAVDGDSAIQILLLIGAFTLIPAALFCLTGFTRILIVLGFIRTAIGTPTSPPNQVLVAIALFLTIFVMAPTFNQIKTTAWDPLEANRITTSQAVERAQVPLREFMFEQTRTKDLALMVRLSQTREQPRTYRDIPTTTLIPAFIISELKTAFQIGFMIFLPFLIIDLIVASTLMSMGMIMLPPVFISLPFKILLFVLVDGWALITDSLVRSFSG
jgi:flagellar biosynthetic protein FliP